MAITDTLSCALFKMLPIPFFARRNLYVERALQERRAAATALQCLEANLLCLSAEIDYLAAADSEAAKTIKTMRALVRDMEANLRYDELELEMAGEEMVE